MTKIQYNVILSLLFIVIAKQYTGTHVAWVFFTLAIIFFFRAFLTYGRAYKERDFARPDIDSVPPSVGDREHNEDAEE